MTTTIEMPAVQTPRMSRRFQGAQSLWRHSTLKRFRHSHGKLGGQDAHILQCNPLYAKAFLVIINVAPLPKSLLCWDSSSPIAPSLPTSQSILITNLPQSTDFFLLRDTSAAFVGRDWPQRPSKIPCMATTRQFSGANLSVAHLNMVVARQPGWILVFLVWWRQCGFCQ